MAAVVFLRVKDMDSDTRITFVCSKTRVAQETCNSSTGAFGGGSPGKTYKVWSGSS